MRGIFGIDPGWGITAVRVAAASVFIRAGYGKLFVLGLPAVTANMTKYGLPHPDVFAVLAGVGEFVGGIALLLGLFGRWLGLFYTVEFAIAFVWVKLRMQTWAAGNLDMMLLAAAVLFVLAGPGRAAIDSLWIERRPRAAAPTRKVTMRRVA